MNDELPPGLSGMKSGDKEVYAERQAVESIRIGPAGYGLLAEFGADGGGMTPIFKLDDTEGIRKVYKAHEDSFPVGIDFTTRWSLFKESDEPTAEYTTMVLDCQWPEVGIEGALIFPVSEYRAILEVCRDASVFAFAIKGEDELDLEKLMFCDAPPPELLDVALELTT